MSARETVLERVGERVPGVPRARRAYGPHRPDDAPTSVTVRERYGDVERPIPPVMLEQRDRLNTIAYEQGLET